MKKMYFLSSLTVMLLLFLSINTTCYSQILGWQFDDPASNGNEVSYDATTVDPNLEISTLIRGVGLERTVFQRGFSSRLPSSSTAVFGSRETAVENDLYLEFKIKAKDGYYASLAIINAKLRRSGKSSSGGYIWMYSLQNDGTGFVPIGADVPFSGTNVTDGDIQAPIDVSGITELQNVPSITTVTLRLYIWGFVNAGSNSFAIGHLDEGVKGNVLSVNGIVSNAPTILAWQFGGNPYSEPVVPASTGHQISSDATTVNPNLEVSTLVRGSGLKTDNGSGKEVSLSSSFNTTTKVAVKGGGTIVEAKANNMYFELEIKAKDGYYTSLSNINVRLRRSGSTMVANNLPGYCWAYSLDDDEPTFIGDYIVFASSSPIVRDELPVDLSGITALQNVPSTKTIKLRLYMWGFANATTNSFSIGPATPGTQENALSISGKVSNTLPVTFSDINTKLQKNGIDVNWKTVSEKNNDYFEIQRSANGKNFSKIGVVKGAGNSNSLNVYSFQDLNPVEGNNYYRIKQVDFNREYIYSATVVQKFIPVTANISVQALADQQMLQVSFYSSNKDLVPLEIISIDGKIIYKKQVSAEKGYNTFLLPIKEKGSIHLLKAYVDNRLSITKFHF